MDVFRLMNMPDRVIAFDQLPKRLLSGFEMCRADGFPKDWKQWLGKKKKLTKIPPEKDMLTGQVRYFDPIIEEDCFFYLVDWTVGPIVERWKEICDFVRQHVPKDFRLMEKIEDMAKPLAANKTDGVTLEVEEVTIIPIPVEFQEIEIKSVAPVEKSKPEEKEIPVLKCTEPGCSKEFKGSYAKNSLRFHMGREHKKETVST